MSLHDLPGDEVGLLALLIIYLTMTITLCGY